MIVQNRPSRLLESVELSPNHEDRDTMLSHGGISANSTSSVKIKFALVLMLQLLVVNSVVYSILLGV